MRIDPADPDFRFPVDSMELSLPELQCLEVTYIRHISVLASFDVPKLQHLFDNGRGEDEPIARGEGLEEDPIGIAPPQPSFEAVGGPSVLDMISTKQSLEMGNEAQKRKHPRRRRKPRRNESVQRHGPIWGPF